VRDIAVRDRLFAVLLEGNPDPRFNPDDRTSLIRSGALDSLGLFQLALWIETEIGEKLDLATIDPVNDWDTITDILAFVRKHVGGSLPGSG
jgi:acyl carrier protein